MKNLFTISLCFLLFQISIFSQEENISGNWLGKLKLPGGLELTIVFKITETAEKKYSALLDSPDQGAKDIPCGDVKIFDDSLVIDVPVVNGSFEGKIDWNNKTVIGKWHQAGSSFNLSLNYTENYTGLNRPQEPKPPFPYKIEEVLIENEKDEVYLSGTLTIPEKGENFPAVILLSGSGPQNRDEEIFGHKPFLVIADFLTRNGFAVLRYDDRGVNASTGDFSKATTYDFANDALAAVEFLKSRKEIDKNKIGLIGHSEGGMIAQIAAVKNPEDVKFLIMLAGVGIEGDELILLQSKIIARLEGRPDEEIDKAMINQEKLVSLLKSDKQNNEIEKEIRQIINESFSNLPELSQETKENIEKMVDMQIKTVMSDWYRSFLKFNPSDYLEKILIPVLALNGEKDAQVPAKENLLAIEEALMKAGNKNFKIVELKGLNHLFQTSETGSISEYGKIEETFSQTALDEMINWLKEITR
jgi:pimeloyl-ACP methyl ester carboxylesterase